MMNTDNFEVYLGINCWDALYPVAFDDVKIWDQVLDGSQIQELYNAYENGIGRGVSRPYLERIRCPSAF